MRVPAVRGPCHTLNTQQFSISASRAFGAGPREQPRWQYRMQTERTLWMSASRELAASWFCALNNNDQRRQASEWVGEQLAKPQQEKRAANVRETTRFYAALLVSILAAVATLVAVWPVVEGYFK